MKKILVIDDELINLTEVQKALGNYYEVNIANSGSAAFDLLEQAVPDLILLDINMPEMNGFQVIDVISKRENWKTVPVIMMADKADVETEVKCFEAGAVDYLSKPIYRGSLFKRVERAIEFETLRRELEAQVVKKVEDAAETAKEPGWSEEEIKKLHYAAIPYDIGREGMPESNLEEKTEKVRPVNQHNRRYAELQHFADMIVKCGEKSGVFEVGYREFEQVFELASRFTKRNEQELQLVLFTLLPLDDDYKDVLVQEEVMRTLSEAIQISLRRVDISVRFSSTQYLVVLIDTKQEYISVVTDRIMQSFYMMYRGKDFVLDYDIAKIRKNNSLE